MNLRSRHAEHLWKLDEHGTLLGRASQKAHREPLKRLARGVLIAIGIALCSASPAGQATTSQTKLTPFRYASFLQAATKLSIESSPPNRLGTM